MKVFHISKTPVAGAAGILNRIINNYTSWDSDVYVQRVKLSAGDFSVDYPKSVPATQIHQKIDEADIIHFHNCGPHDFQLHPLQKPFVIQLHSEPRVRRQYVDRYPGKCVTICQKHVLLYREIWSNFPCVPNLIPIEEEAYTPCYDGNKRVTFFYAPSSTVSLPDYRKTCAGKGYNQTLKVFEKLRKNYGKQVEIIIKTRSPKSEVLSKKKCSDVVIDECVTGGYHLSSLEGLAMGCITVANISTEVENIVRHVSLCGSEKMPWINTSIDHLYKTLESLVKLKQTNYREFQKLRQFSRDWMVSYWHPSDLIQRYIDLYYRIIEGHTAENAPKHTPKPSVLSQKNGQLPPIEQPTTRKDFNDPWKNLGVSSNLSYVRAKRRSVYIKYDALQRDKEIPVREFFKKHKERSAIVMGSGPSVQRINVEKFIAQNDPLKLNCNFYFKGFTHKPDYWFNIDSTCLNECVRNIDVRTPIIINPPLRYQALDHVRSFISKAAPSFEKHFGQHFELERPCTVATIMTLYAMWMGCNPIYIIGVDLSQSKGQNNYFYSEKNKNYNEKFRDFSNNYSHIINEFRMMKDVGDRRGIKIFNLDPKPHYFNIFPVYK